MWCHMLLPSAGSSMGPGALNEHLELLMPLPPPAGPIVAAEGTWGGKINHNFRAL